MKVNIETQHLCSNVLGGVSYYTINLIEALVKRNTNKYSVSFFDYNRELDNRRYIEGYFDDDTLKKLDVFECNSLSYKEILEGNLIKNKKTYMSKSYEQYFGAKFDICHLPVSYGIPENITQKTIVTVHDIMPILPAFKGAWPERAEAMFQKTLEYISKKSDIEIIADSLTTKIDLMQYLNISDDRIHVIHLGYNPKKFYKEEDRNVLKQLGIDYPYVLYLGRLDSRKGIIDILEAYKIIKQRNGNVKLVISGALDSSSVEVKEYLKNYKNILDVNFTDFVSETEKRVLLSCAELFLFPSEYEGFGLPILEAMACGAPVVTTRVSSLPEVGGDAVKYVSPNKPEELAETIQQMLDKEDLRKEYTKKGCEQCRKFSWDKTAEMTEAVYEFVHQR